MMIQLENRFFQFSLDPDLGEWGLASPALPQLAFSSARLRVEYRINPALGGKQYHAPDHWRSSEVKPETIIFPLHGSAQQAQILAGDQQHGLSINITFALLEETPLFLWKLEVANHGNHPVFLDRLWMLLNPFLVEPGAAPGYSDASALFFLANGWQSFNYSGVYAPEERLKRSRMGFLTSPLRVNQGTPQPRARGHFSSDFFGALGHRRQKAGLLYGFLSQRQHFGSIEAKLRHNPPWTGVWANGDGARLDPGSAITTDWACIQIFSQDDPDPFGPYFRAVAREHGLPEEARTAAPTGWCSWYQFYRQVSADGIRRALHTLQAQRNELPVQIVQIDDGYQTFVGDWSTFTPGFAAGIAPLAAEIRAAGYKPGLWMAPFLVDPRARLAKDHPEWLLHGFLNRPVNAGYGFWGTFTTALDLSHPQALNHIQALVDQAIRTWGIEYLKLDFLHAGALPGRHFDPTRTRAQLLRLGLQAIRQAAGAETFLLGCGCPLGPAIGLIDSMRVGPDVDVRWEPAVFGISTFFRKEPDLPSIRNANRNPLVRAPLHRRLWINDPDCLLLSPKPPLTFTEIQGRATLIAMTGGALFFSDDLQQLPADCLRLAQFILSPIGKRPRLLDWTRPEMPSLLRLDLEGPIGVWYLLAFFNWQDKPADINFSLQDFILPADQAFLFREIWGGECGLITNGFFKLHPVPAHGAILLALRPHQPDSPTFVGSELHISQGLEVADWQPNAAGLTALIQRSGKSSGYVYLYLPQPPILASLNNNPLTWQTYKAAEQIYAFPLSFDKNALLQIQF